MLHKEKNEVGKGLIQASNFSPLGEYDGESIDQGGVFVVPGYTTRSNLCFVSKMLSAFLFL